MLFFKLKRRVMKKLKAFRKLKGKNISNYSSFFSARLISIIAIILLLVSVNYLYAKNQELQKLQQKQTLSPTPTNLVTPTTQPVKQKTNIIKDTVPPTSISAERKKVAVTLSDSVLSGTFYCYEDKANEIMTTQNNLNLALKTMSICGDTLQFKISTCFNNCSQSSKTCLNNCFLNRGESDQIACNNGCLSQNTACGDNCPKGTECSDKYSGDIDRLRNQLIQMKNQYCP